MSLGFTTNVSLMAPQDCPFVRGGVAPLRTKHRKGKTQNARTIPAGCVVSHHPVCAIPLPLPFLSLLSCPQSLVEALMAVGPPNITLRFNGVERARVGYSRPKGASVRKSSARADPLTN
jgi:hypothetical protein